MLLSTSIHGGYTTSFISPQGEGQNDSNSISGHVVNAKASTSTALSCSPSSIDVGRFTICNANVTGLSPTGSVSFTKNSSTGNFTSPYAVCGNGCPGAYHTSYTDAAKSNITVTITASYSGDAYNNPSTGTFYLSITRPARVISVGFGESQLGLGGVSGGLVANQSSTTGISVTISGSTDPFGTSVDVTTEKLSTPNPGVATPALASPAYYDVFVTGLSSGNAQVCIRSGTPISGAIMQYWAGATWTNASNITQGSGNVCGSIPVSALTGTNLVLGTATQSPPPPANMTIIGLDAIILYTIIGLIIAIVLVVLIIKSVTNRRSASGKNATQIP